MPGKTPKRAINVEVLLAWRLNDQTWLLNGLMSNAKTG